MYGRILIATDGSALSRKATEEGIALAKSIGASVVGFHARMPVLIPYYTDLLLVMPQKVADQMEKKTLDAAKRYLTKMADLAKKSGVAFKGVHVVDGAPADAIIRIAKKEKCELIVMASHGRRGISRLLLGSETNHVLANARLPVLVIR